MTTLHPALTAFTLVTPETFVDFADTVGAELVSLQDQGAEDTAIEDVANQVLALRAVLQEGTPTNGRIPESLHHIREGLVQMRTSLFERRETVKGRLEGRLGSRRHQVPKIFDHMDDTVRLLVGQLRRIQLPDDSVRDDPLDDHILSQKREIQNALHDLGLLRKAIENLAHDISKTLLFRLLSNEALRALAKHRQVRPLYDELREIYSAQVPPLEESGSGVEEDFWGNQITYVPGEGTTRTEPAPFQDDTFLDPSRMSDDERHFLELGS